MIDYSSLMRRNTYVWQDKVPSKELIDKLLKDLIKYTPSKQNLFRYTLVVADNHTNLENKLRADALEMNIKTKDTKIFMYEKEKKVNIQSKK